MNDKLHLNSSIIIHLFVHIVCRNGLQSFAIEKLVSLINGEFTYWDNWFLSFALKHLHTVSINGEHNLQFIGKIETSITFSFIFNLFTTIESFCFLSFYKNMYSF